MNRATNLPRTTTMIRTILPFGAALAAAVTLTPAAAINFELGGASVQLNNLYTIGAAQRVAARDPRLIGLGNGGLGYSTNIDDGNLAFDKGDIVAGATKLTSDLTVRYGAFGFFTRGTGVYNPVIGNAKGLFNAANYGAGKEFDLSELNRKAKAVENAVGRKAEILDAYAFGDIPLGARTLTLKVGRQSINWGESTFVLNGLNSLLALDANKVRVPGFELQELVRPAGSVWGAMELLDGISGEAFYQFEWRPTLTDAAGTFWSTNDAVGAGGTQVNIGFGRMGENTPAGVTTLPGAPGLACLNVAPSSVATDCAPIGSTIPRIADRTAKNDGQFGGALRMPIPFLNDLQLGLYAANYHSRLPVVSAISRSSPAYLPNQADTAAYLVEYPEDIHLFGASFNTTIGSWALQGEYSYKQGQPLQLSSVELILAAVGAPSQINNAAGATLGNQYLQGFRRKNVQQLDLGVTRILSPLPLLGYDQLLLIGEVAVMHVNGLEAPQVLAYEAPDTTTPNAGSTALNPVLAANLPVTPYSNYADATSWGYNLALRANYNNLIGPVSLEPTLRFVHDVTGTSPSPIANFVEGRKEADFLMGFSYLDNWKAELGYVNFFGAGTRNLLSDRDVIEANVRYSF